MTFKVANIISAFNSKSGGPPRAVKLIAAAGQGHWTADLFTTDYVEARSDSLLVREFPGHANVFPASCRTPLGGLRMLAGFDMTYRSQLIKGVSPDLVHIHGMWSPFLAAFAMTARRNGIPYVLAPHGMLEPWSLTVHARRKAFALKSYQGRVLSSATALHATSEMEAGHLRQLTNDRVPVFIVPNAVEEPLPFDAATSDAATAQPRTLLFLSRLHEKKGLDMLLEVWGQLRPAQWRLQIVGSGEPDYVNRLRQYCDTHQLPRVEFIPHVEGEEREAAFADAAVFVLPTFSENFGNVVVEALMRGVPVITTTGTPWSEIPARGCGWYIEPTATALKEVLAGVFDTPALALRQMGERGRAYATNNFSLPVVRDALLQMYRFAIAPGARHVS